MSTNVDTFPLLFQEPGGLLHRAVAGVMLLLWVAYKAIDQYNLVSKTEHTDSRAKYNSTGNIGSVLHRNGCW